MNHKLRTTLDWIELPTIIFSVLLSKSKTWNKESNKKTLDFIENDSFPQWRKESKPFKILRFFLKLKLNKK